MLVPVLHSDIDRDPKGGHVPELSTKYKKRTGLTFFSFLNDGDFVPFYRDIA
jgi:hypothetical protein